MDEEAIKRAASEAVNDLQLDCEIKDICRSPDGRGWCVQFTGKYGQFCDEFKNQFGRENSQEIIREKIKSHLLKQITKIRSSTGRKRTGGNTMAEKRRRSGSETLTAPLKVVEEVVGQATEMVSPVIDQAAAVTKTALDTAAGAAQSVIPRGVGAGGQSSGRSRRNSPGATVKKSIKRSTKRAKAATDRTAKAGKRVARRAGKQAKKATRSARKSVARASRAASASTRRKSGGKKRR